MKKINKIEENENTNEEEELTPMQTSLGMGLVFGLLCGVAGLLFWSFSYGIVSGLEAGITGAIGGFIFGTIFTLIPEFDIL